MRKYVLTKTINFKDGTEETYKREEIQQGELEDSMIECLTDPLVSSVIFVVVCIDKKEG